MNLKSHHQSAAFTLIELVISAALMAVVLGSSYLCLNAGLLGKQIIEKRSDAVQSARTALNLIAADLRAAVPMPGKVEFVGLRRSISEMDADNLDFATRNYSPRAVREGDACEISYFLTRDPQSNSFILTRRRDATPDPEPTDGGPREEIARGVRSLHFEYCDGFDWFDDWGDPEGKTKGMTLPPSNSYGLPEAVRITLQFDPESTTNAPMSFQTVARLDLAPFFNRQATASQNNASQAAPEGGAQ